MKFTICLIFSVLLSTCLVSSSPLSWSEGKIKNAKEFATSLLSKLESQKDKALDEAGRFVASLPYFYIFAADKLNELSGALEPVRQNIESIKSKIPTDSDELKEILAGIETDLFLVGIQLKEIISEKVASGKEVAELVKTKIQSLELSDVKETFESLKTKLESTDLSEMKNDAKEFVQNAWNNIDKPIYEVAVIVEDLKQASKSIVAHIPTSTDELKGALQKVLRKTGELKNKLKKMTGLGSNRWYI